jgi:GTP-binding protein
MIPSDSNDIKKEYETLLHELQAYNSELLDKNRMLAITKSDLLDEELTQELAKELPEIKHVFISSIANNGLVELNDMLWNELNND